MNQQLHRTRELIAKNGFRCIAAEDVDRDKDDPRGTLHLEWWAGPRGVIILQFDQDKDGVMSFADWPLGHTFEELEKAVASNQPGRDAAQTKGK